MKVSKVVSVLVFLPFLNAQSQQSPTSFLLPNFSEQRNLDNIRDDDPILDFKKTVGTINGEFGVNDNGAAFYSIPLIIPPGSGGMVPDVKIEYNSQSGDGWLGKGWTISGFSSISRMSKTFYHDNKTEGLQFNNSDHFILDGNVLIPIIGSNGMNGTEYRTEVESFSKIFSYNYNGSTEPDYFIVQTKDGRIIEYGNTNDSKHKLPFLNKTITWYVNKISDPNKNYISYTYNNDNNMGGVLPNTINYTGNDNSPSLLPYNIIKFIYTASTFQKKSYLYGTLLLNNMIMKEIQITNENALVKRYEFNYLSEFKPLLNNITEYNSIGESYNPTTFNYTSRGFNEFEYWYPNISLYTVAGTEFSWNEDHPRELADVNGDGMADIIGFGYSNVYVSLSNGHGYNPQQIWYNYDFGIASGWLSHTVSNPNTDETHPRHLADINGDGMADIVGFAPDGVYVALSDGSSFNQKQKWVSCFGAAASAGAFKNETIHPRFIVDVNGDKLPDIVGFGNDGVRVGINTGYSFVIDPNWSLSFWGNTAGNWIFPPIVPPIPNPNQLLRTMADVNGDGMVDIVGFHMNDVYVSLSTGTGFTAPQSWISNNYCYNQSAGTWDANSTPRYVQDVNGDGLADIVGFYHNNVQVALSNGIDRFVQELLPWHEWFDTDAGYSNNRNDQFPRYLADVNGDGLVDIVGFPHVGTVYSINTGTSFQAAVLFASGSFGFDDWGGTTTHIRTIADVNGDGRADIIGFGHDAVVTVVSRLDDERKIEKITNGLGFRVLFSYKPIINNTPVYKYNGHEIYPFLKFAGSLKVVDHNDIENGIGSFNSIYYEYQDALAHLWGKGFLGFQKIIEKSFVDNVNTRKQKDFSLDYVHCFKQLANLQSTVDGNLAKSTSFIYNNLSYPNSLRFSPRLCATTSIDSILKNTVTKEFCLKDSSYDAYGNPLRIITNTYNASILELKLTEDFQYTSAASWCPNKIKNIKTTKEKPGETAYIRIKDYEYNTTNGNLLKESSDPTDTKGTVIIYTNFDNYGNPWKKTLSALNSNLQLPDINEYFKYDVKGRFIIEKKNPLGHIVTRKYEPKFGNLINEKDENNILTDYSYDDFGRLKTIMNVTENTSSQFLCEWVTTNGQNIPSFALYKNVSITSCYPKKPSITLYDKLCRELQTEEIILNGEKVYLQKEYNLRGLLTNISLPYKDIASILWTTIQYDAYCRKISQDNTDGSNITINYNEKTTQTTTTNNNESQKQLITVNSLDQIINAEDNNNVKVNNTYFSSGLLKESYVDGMNATQYTSFSYDLQGRRLSIHEPNSGTTKTEYNAYGQVTKQTDAKNNVIDMQYDLLGRVTKKTQQEGTTIYDYDNQLQGISSIGKISSITANWNNGTVRDKYYYDFLGRDSVSIEIIDGRSFIEKREYDQCGRLDKLTYPDNFVIQHLYKNGELFQLRNLETEQLIWQAINEDNFGNITDFKFGNDVVSTKSYESTTARLSTIKTFKNGNPVQDWIYTYNNFGNISTRKDQVANSNFATQSEKFYYDDLNRLNSIININEGSTDSILFDNFGNITRKDGVGNYAYHPIQLNAVTQINNSTNNSSTPQEISYTSFNKVLQINENAGTDNIEFTYGPDYSRRKTSYSNNQNLSLNKYFIAGNYEEEENQNYGLIKNHYIYGSEGLVAIYRFTESDNTGNMYYIHTDQLGSFDRITDDNGTIVDNYSFNAWGMHRDANNWGLPDVVTHLFTRGFTGHEHLDKFGLINMNGRMYDPNLGRFLSPDNYLQVPDNTQNFNRYSYCLNNPLKYTDPKGELFWMVLPAISGLLNLAANSNQIHDFWQGIGYFGIGALAGGSGVIAGQSVAGILNFGGFAGGAIIGASGGFAGGFVGGASNSWASGASFSQGLLTGLANGGYGALAGGLIGGLISGLDAIKSNANFWNGKVIEVGGAKISNGEFLDEEIPAGQKPTATGEIATRPGNANYGKYGWTRNGGKKQHFGIDYKGEVGDDVYAMYDGKVSQIGGSKDYGKNFVRTTSILNGKSYYVDYGHMSQYSVSLKDQVSGGQLIGKIGTLGIPKNMPVHVHISVWRPVNWHQGFVMPWWN